MPSRANYDLLPRTSSDSFSASSEEFKDKPLRRAPHKLIRILLLPLKTLWLLRPLLRGAIQTCGRTCRPLYIVLLLCTLVLWQLAFNGSYMDASAFSIPPDETVFIAANIVDGDLITGAWGRSLQGLVELIGEDRVYVSIYGGPATALKELAQQITCTKSIVAEEEFPLDLASIPRTELPTGESRIKRIAYLAEVRNKALEPLAAMAGKKAFTKVLFINDVFFEPADAARLLWGTNRDAEGKAIYKAVCATDFITSWKYYDTFATRDVEGYSIGVPIFPWFADEGDAISRKDVLAGREAVRVKSCWGGMVAFDGRYFEGTVKGKEEKSKIVKDVKRDSEESENRKQSPQLPLRFRSEAEPFWDSSECCLIHADIMASAPFPPLSTFASISEEDPSLTGLHAHQDTKGIQKEQPWDTGIYMNPYVRVSYDASTHGWIRMGQRYERLLAPLQGLLNQLAKMPRWNARRTEVEGEIIHDRQWVSLNTNDGTRDVAIDEEREFGSADSTWQGSGAKKEKRATIGNVKGKEYWAGEGYYVDFNRTASRGGYCGVRQLLVVKEDRKEGEGNWDNLLDKVPPLDVQ